MSAGSKGVALITGAAEGIGRAISLRLAADGFNVALLDLRANERKLGEVAQQIGRDNPERNVISMYGDVSVDDDVKNAVSVTVDRLGGLDVMIANAGINIHHPLHETTLDEFERMMAVNVRGTFLSFKYAALQMIKQGRGGRMISAGSIAGKKGMEESSVYAATKFAIRGLTQSAAMEYGKYGINVNSYAPGTIETSLLDKLDEYHTSTSGTSRGSWTSSLNNTNVLKHNGKPNDIVGLVSFLVSKDAAFITGQTINVDGGTVFD